MGTMKSGYPSKLEISENTRVDCFKYWAIPMYTRDDLKAITGILGAFITGNSDPRKARIQ